MTLLTSKLEILEDMLRWNLSISYSLHFQSFTLQASFNATFTNQKLNLKISLQISKRGQMYKCSKKNLRVDLDPVNIGTICNENYDEQIGESYSFIQVTIIQLLTWIMFVFLMQVQFKMELDQGNMLRINYHMAHIRNNNAGHIFIISKVQRRSSHFLNVN